MRKVKKERQLVEKEVVVSNQVFCDWCENEFKYDDESWQPTVPNSKLYPPSNMSSIDVEFECKFTLSTSSYPDWLGTDGFEVEDLCPNCVVKLKQLLIEVGIKVKEINL